MFLLVAVGQARLRALNQTTTLMHLSDEVLNCYSALLHNTRTCIFTHYLVQLSLMIDGILWHRRSEPCKGWAG
jgi:hypothetical protein